MGMWIVFPASVMSVSRQDAPSVASRGVPSWLDSCNKYLVSSEHKQEHKICLRALRISVRPFGKEVRLWLSELKR